MRLRFTIFAALLLCPSLGFASRHSQRAHGAIVYNESGCSHCHTISSVGGHKGPDMTAVGRRLKKEQLRQQIVDGSKRMPPFGDVLQHQELDDLVAYLRSCRDKPKK